jgi:hypothetical protein
MMFLYTIVQHFDDATYKLFQIDWLIIPYRPKEKGHDVGFYIDGVRSIVSYGPFTVWVIVIINLCRYL